VRTIIHARVTKTAVDALAAGQIIRDVDLKGFGVRRQRVVATCFVRKKVHGRDRWITIGRHGSPWTAEKARKEAERILYGLSAGADAQLQKRLEREKPTMRKAADEFMASYGPKLKPRTREEYQRLLKLHIVPKLGSRLVADLNKGHIAHFHARMAQTPASLISRWPCSPSSCAGARTSATGPNSPTLAAAQRSTP
jgi:hypothetical protein